MKQESIVRLAVITVAFAIAGGTASAQGPGGNQLRGGKPSTTAGADRAQDQVKQRIQAQAQQRVQGQLQAQVQSRTQSQMQGRIQAESKRAAEVAQRAVENTARRAGSMSSGREVADGASLKGNASASTRGNSAANVGVRVNANANVAATANASRVEGVSEPDLVIYDNIFGRFNPMRKDASEGANTNAHAGSIANGQGHQHFDVARGIQVATQKRRAEISQLRDQAVATGQEDLMLRADEMEQRLNVFVETHQQLERGRAGQGVPPRTATRLNGSLEGSTRVQD